MNQKNFTVGSTLIISCVFVFLLNSCGPSGASVSGKVIDFITGKPLPNANIMSEANTDIVEEQSQAKRKTSSKNDGSFMLKKLLPNKYYKASVNLSPYIQEKFSFRTPDIGQTKMIDNTILLFKPPPKIGASLYNQGEYSPLSEAPKKVLADVGFGNSDFRYFTMDELEKATNVNIGHKISFWGDEPMFLYPITISDKFYTSSKGKPLFPSKMAMAGVYFHKKNNVIKGIKSYKCKDDEYSQDSRYGAYWFYLDGYINIPTKYKRLDNKHFQLIDTRRLSRGQYYLMAGKKLSEKAKAGWLIKIN